MDPLKAEWIKIQCLRCPFSKEAFQVLNLRGSMKEALQAERNSIDRGLQGRSSLLGIGVSSS